MPIHWVGETTLQPALSFRVLLMRTVETTDSSRMQTEIRLPQPTSYQRFATSKTSFPIWRDLTTQEKVQRRLSTTMSGLRTGPTWALRAHCRTSTFTVIT